MAAVSSSAWAKPGAWALESEQLDSSAAAAAAAAATSALDKGYSSPDSHQSPAEFPSLSSAATTKIPKKKKKNQTLTLAEFTSAPTSALSSSSSAKFQPSSKTLASEVDLHALPTGPRERSEEELQRSRGFGLGFGGNRDGRGPARASDERHGPSREPRDNGPSRADEVDDWGAAKKSSFGGFERRERDRDRDRGFFDSQSRADESDSWTSKKDRMAMPVSEGRRERRGFDFNREAGSDGADAESWGKKRGEESVTANGGRPRLVLQPRTLPVAVNGANGEERKVAEMTKPKGANPFGEARPREEVLKEKGKDWKEIDEKLEAVKIQEVSGGGRKGFGVGKEDRTERAWRKQEDKEVNDGAIAPPGYDF